MYADDEDGDMCRVCRNGPTPDNALSYPLYSDNAPDVLPFREFVYEALVRFHQHLEKLARLVYVVFCFLFVVPLYTCWIFRFYFGKESFYPAREDLSLLTVFNDFFLGTMLFFWIILVSVISYLVFDFLGHKHTELDLANEQEHPGLEQTNADLESDMESDDSDAEDAFNPPPVPAPFGAHEAHPLFRIPGMRDILNNAQEQHEQAMAEDPQADEIEVLELGVFPVFFGVFIDICTLELFGGSLSSRRGILWFLRDPNDIEFDLAKYMIKTPLRRQFINIGVSLLAYYVISVLLLYLPLKLLSCIPNLLPVDFGDPMNRVGSDVIFVISTFYFPKFHPQLTFTNFIKYFVTVVTKALHLDEYMLLPTLADQQPDNYYESVKPTNFKKRILSFFFASWVLLFISVSLLIGLPMAIGRGSFKALSIDNPNDIICFFTGLFTLWVIVKSINILDSLSAFVYQQSLEYSLT
eukprot:gene7841-9202_t